MEFAIETLQQTTTTWSRWLIFLATLLTFWGLSIYRRWGKQKQELENLKKLQIALEIQKLLLEIELMELVIRSHDLLDRIKMPRIELQRRCEEKPDATPAMLPWSDKIIYGLLGSFLFLLIIVLFYMVAHLEAIQNTQQNYVSFVKELLLSIGCGTGTAMIPGNKPWNFIFYGFSLPLLLLLLMTEFSL